MPSLRRFSTALITGAAVVAGTGLAVAASGSATAGDEQGAPLTLTGTVEGLTPGAARDLPVTIANPNAKPRVVAAITTAVTATPPSCPDAALRVGDLPAPVTVPGDASAVGHLPVRLAATAPDACQGAVFALRFSTTGRGEGSLVVPAPATPATPPATATPTGSWKTVTVTRRRKVCRTRRVRVRGTVRRRKVCRIVLVKVKVRVPR